MNALQRLDELLEEWRDIAAKAEKLQSGGPLNPGTPYQIQTFLDQYDAWYTAASEVLPPDLKDRLERELTNPPGDCCVTDFMTYPTRTGPDDKGVYDADNPHVVVPTKFQFTYPYDHCFREPFLRQVQVLVEAKHRPELAHDRGLHQQSAGTELHLESLHPAVVEAAGALFADKHYRDAIFRSCVALAGTVRRKAGCNVKEETALMRRVFSSKQPILRVSDDEGQREGFLSLFAGVSMGLRNPRAHHSIGGEDPDAVEALEWLAFVSALMRVVDRAERVDDSSLGV